MDITHYKIDAIFRPHRLEPVQEALEALDLKGITVSDVRGTGHQRAVSHSFRGSQYGHLLLPHVKLEVVVPAAALDEALQAIQSSATTGEVGDGKIFVTPVYEIVRIRTGERGSAALD